MSIPPINQTRMEHESVHFSCVKEDPHSAVQWYKDGVPLDDVPSLTGRFLVTPEGSLDVYDASPNDNGFYACRIVSAKGAMSAGAFLNVQCKQFSSRCHLGCAYKRKTVTGGIGGVSW